MISKNQAGEPFLTLSGSEGKIMPGVTRLDNHEALAWEVAKDRLLELQDGRSLSFEVDDDTWLIVLFVADLDQDRLSMTPSLARNFVEGSLQCRRAVLVRRYFCS